MKNLVLAFFVLAVCGTTALAGVEVIPYSGLWDNGNPSSGCAVTFEFNYDYTKMVATTVENPYQNNGCLQNGFINVVDCSYRLNGVLDCGNGRFLDSKTFILSGKTLRPLR